MVEHCFREFIRSTKLNENSNLTKTMKGKVRQRPRQIVKAKKNRQIFLNHSASVSLTLPLKKYVNKISPTLTYLSETKHCEFQSGYYTLVRIDCGTDEFYMDPAFQPVHGGQTRYMTVFYVKMHMSL